MPAEVTLQAYQNQAYRATVRQIFPSADRAKAIVEVRVSILNPDAHVKPEMTASVTFQEPGAKPAPDGARHVPGTVLIPKRAVTEMRGQPAVWVVSHGTASHRTVILGADRLDQVEVKSGVMSGDTVILNPPPALTDGALVRVKGS